MYVGMFKNPNKLHGKNVTLIDKDSEIYGV